MRNNRWRIIPTRLCRKGREQNCFMRALEWFVGFICCLTYEYEDGERTPFRGSNFSIYARSEYGSTMQIQQIRQ